MTNAAQPTNGVVSHEEWTAARKALLETLTQVLDMVPGTCSEEYAAP